MVAADAALESQSVLVGKFEGPTSVNDLTSIPVAKTLLGDAQRFSMPLTEESSSKAASLNSFVGVCLWVQRAKICRRHSCRHYYSYRPVVDETVTAIVAVVAIYFVLTRSSPPWPPGTQCHLLGPIGL